MKSKKKEKNEEEKGRKENRRRAGWLHCVGVGGKRGGRK